MKVGECIEKLVVSLDNFCLHPLQNIAEAILIRTDS